MFQKDQEKCMEYVNEGIEKSDKAPILKEYKAIQLIQRGNRDDALVLLKEVMGMNTERKQEAAQMYAQILLEDKRYKEAEETFKSIVDEDPDNPDNYFNLGYLYVQMSIEAKDAENTELAAEYLKKAKDQFETVLSMRPDDLLVMEAVGDLYAELKDYTTAEYYYQQMVDKNPMNPKYLKKLSQVIYLQGRHDEGQDLWDQAKAIESLD
jgi:tetratricopeptide (TPR) repeat protein